MLHFKGYRKSYGPVVVLTVGDLLIDPGIFWVKGINGSGKSTLLKTVAGIIGFDGDILLDGHISVKKQPVAYRRLVNFAEAEPVFPEFLTGMEMIRLFADAKGGAEGQEDYYIDSMGMSDYIDEPLGTYSSGMLKKLSIVLAFIGNPRLILLDEPLITIDVLSLKVLYRWIEERHHNDRVSFLLSSHQPLELDKVTPVREIFVEMQTVKCKA